MTAPGSVRYRTNLIRTLRVEEKRDEQRQRLTRILVVGSLCLLAISVIYTGLNIWSMQSVLRVESENLARLKAEYAKYNASKEIIDKSDVETLNQLQLSSIFWSRKLVALGQHLPEDYWLKSIAFQNKDLKVTGSANPSMDEGVLLGLQKYVESLLADTAFSKEFPIVRLSNATRPSSETSLSFEFVATGTQPKAQ
jgi:Tfp pilus assembly protein PilN